MDDLKGQLRSVWDIMVSPRRTLLSLPNDRLWPMAFLISVYFTLARLVRQGWMARMSTTVGSSLFALAIFLVLSFGAFCVVGAFFHVLIRILGKKLTLRKVLNILGYSQAPRLYLSVPLSIITALLPEEMRPALIAGLQNPAGLVVVCGGSMLLLYSIVLMIWGFAISPDQRLAGTTNEVI